MPQLRYQHVPLVYVLAFFALAILYAIQAKLLSSLCFGAQRLCCASGLMFVSPGSAMSSG